MALKGLTGDPIHRGNWFGLPDIGATEKLSNFFGQGRTAGGGSNLGGNQTQTTLVPSSSGQFVPSGGAGAYGVQGGNYLQPARQNVVSGGGGGGGAPVGPQQTFTSPPMQSTPQFNQPDYDAMIAPALAALDSAQAPAQSAYEANLAGIDASTASRSGQLQADLAETQRARDATSGKLTGQTESAVDEARRQFSEISQGLQARYGGTSGSGAFVEGLAGRETLRNIGQNRQALTQALVDLDNNAEDVRMRISLAQDDVKQQAEAAKSQAKAQLDNTLNSLRMAKGELLGRKMELAQNAMQFYQSQVADINARNAAFEQQLYSQQQQYNNQLAEKRAGVSSQLKALQLKTINGVPFSWNPYTGALNKVQAGGGQFGQGQIEDAGTSEEDQLLNEWGLG